MQCSSYLIPKSGPGWTATTKGCSPSTWSFRVRQPGALCPPTWSLTCPSSSGLGLLTLTGSRATVQGLNGLVVLVNISTRPAPQIGHPTRPSGERTARWTSARRTQAAPGQTRVARAAPGQTRVARAAPGQTRVARSIRGAAPRAAADRATHRDDRLPVHTLGPAQQPSGVDGCSCRTPQRAVGCLATSPGLIDWRQITGLAA